MIRKNLALAIASALTISCAAVAAPYDDQVLARSDSLSPFDRAYEAGKKQNNTDVQYIQTKEVAAPSAVLDLSRDDPVISVQETQTEIQYRQTLADLEKKKRQLAEDTNLANQNLRAAEMSARMTAEERKQALMAQQIELKKALEMNQQAQSKAEEIKASQLAEISAAKTQSSKLVLLAQNNAQAIEQSAKQRVTLERIDPTVVLNETVTAEFQSATIKQIVESIMPIGWRVKTDFSVVPELNTRRYEFYSTDPRDLALRKLTMSVRDARVRFQYFWDLKDNSGNPSPMILVTDRLN